MAECFENISIYIFFNIRRKQQALSLVENLKIIQTLENTGKRLDSLLAQDKYPETIKLWLGK